MTSLRYTTFFSFLLIISGIELSAQQAGRMTEKEVELQKIFIDASKEKLLGKYENAAVLFKEVLKRDENNHAAAYELARIYDVLDQNDKALSSAKMAVSLDEQNSWYQMFLGDVYQKMGNHKEASVIYEQLAKNDPENEYYYYKWAYYLVAANEVEAAIKVYDALEKKIGVNEEASKRKHTLYLGLGNERKAVKELEKLIEAYPYHVDYYHLLAGFYQQSNKKELAAELYRKILNLEPDDPKAILALTETTGPVNSDVEFLQSLHPIFANSEIDIDSKVKKIIPFIQKVAQGNRESTKLSVATLNLIQILSDVHPDEAKTWSAYGDVLYYSGEIKPALDKYLKAIDLDKKVFTIWEQIMYIQTELQDIDGLLSISNNALDLFPNQAKAYYFNGLANTEKEQYAEALDVFQQALMMSSKNIPLKFDIYARLGELYFHLKQYDRSYEAFEKALELNGKDARLLNNYSYCLAQRGDRLNRAKEMSALSNEISPNVPLYQGTYGWIMYKMKSYKDAQKWFEKSVKNGGDKLPVILEHYGDLLYQMEDVENAMHYWQKAQELGAKSELLEKKISDRKLYE